MLDKCTCVWWKSWIEKRRRRRRDRNSLCGLIPTWDNNGSMPFQGSLPGLISLPDISNGVNPQALRPNIQPSTSFAWNEITTRQKRRNVHFTWFRQLLCPEIGWPWLWYEWIMRVRDTALMCKCRLTEQFLKCLNHTPLRMETQQTRSGHNILFVFGFQYLLMVLLLLYPKLDRDLENTASYSCVLGRNNPNFWLLLIWQPRD